MSINLNLTLSDLKFSFFKVTVTAIFFGNYYKNNPTNLIQVNNNTVATPNSKKPHIIQPCTLRITSKSNICKLTAGSSHEQL